MRLFAQVQIRFKPSGIKSNLHLSGEALTVKENIVCTTCCRKLLIGKDKLVEDK